MEQSIVRVYEKRIRKTHRVANQTELKLKKQQASLLYFKKEISRHLGMLEEHSDSGNEHAQKRLESIKMKIAQVDKIVPYLEKYVAVNRQAEMQTIAVLKESCTMELQHNSSAGDAKSPRVRGGHCNLPPEVSRLLHLDSPSTSASSNSQQLIPENPYASLTEVRKEAAEYSQKIQTNYAELNFPQAQRNPNMRPRSVNYSEVMIIPQHKNVQSSSDDNSKAKKEQSLPQSSPCSPPSSVSYTEVLILPPRNSMPASSDEPTSVKKDQSPSPSSPSRQVDTKFESTDRNEFNACLHDATLTPGGVANDSGDITLLAEGIDADVSISSESNAVNVSTSTSSSSPISSALTSPARRQPRPPPPPRVDSMPVLPAAPQLASPSKEKVNLSPSRVPPPKADKPKSSRWGGSSLSNGNSHAVDVSTNVMDKIMVCSLCSV